MPTSVGLVGGIAL
ncbi:Protein of unknown function [Anaplasma phagocytophilum]|uniref:Uncharacterized protein n=1 Tax=Anaplasma phagocytophilum TaxID=948 RepID=A0A098EDT3_ANAPH|nr:Protein of unknown function [Anaplasma phagocytophilum]